MGANEDNKQADAGEGKKETPEKSDSPKNDKAGNRRAPPATTTTKKSFFGLGPRMPQPPKRKKPNRGRPAGEKPGYQGRRPGQPAPRKPGYKPNSPWTKF